MQIFLILLAIGVVVKYPWLLLVIVPGIVYYVHRSRAKKKTGHGSPEYDDSLFGRGSKKQINSYSSMYANAHSGNLDRKSSIVSIFTKKWYAKACESFVVIDIETTGLEKSIDHIIEIAAIRYEGGVEQGKFSSLIRPPIQIPSEATAVHHITNAMVAKADTISSVMPRFLDFVGDDLLVGHNVNFDIGFIEIAARELGYDPQWKYIDTISVAKKAYPGLPDYKQQTILKAIKYKQPSTHRAEDDARGCAEILTRTLIRLANGDLRIPA